MIKTLSMVALLVMAAGPIAAQSASASTSMASSGTMVVDAAGARLAPVDHVDSDGSVEILIDDRVVTIPASTLSKVNGRLMTSLKKTQVIAQQ